MLLLLFFFISGNSQWHEAALGMRASLCALPMGTPLWLSLYLFHNRESGFIYLPYPFTALSDLLEAVGDAWLLCLFLCGRSSRFYIWLWFIEPWDTKRFCSVFQHSEIPMGVVDNTWHHVCVTWKAHEKILTVYKDGEKKYSTNRFWSREQNEEIEGKYCYPY